MAKGRNGSLSDLSGEELIFRESGSGTRRMIEAHLHAKGISTEDLHIAMELGTSEAVVNAVEQSLGVSIVSRWAAEKALQLGTVVEARLEGLPIQRDFYLAVGKRPQTRATEAFLEYLAGADIK